MNISRKHFLYYGIWVIAALFFALMTLLITLQEEERLSFFSIFAYEILCITPWILSTPLLVKSLNKFPLNDGINTGHIAIHIGLFLILAVAAAIWQVAVNQYLAIYLIDYLRPFSFTLVKNDFITFFQIRLLLYLLFIAVFYVIKLYEKKDHVELEESKLRSELLKAEFDELSTGIHPYLMINSIDAALRQTSNHEQLERTIYKLSNFLRLLLKVMNQNLLTVENNLKIQNEYFELMSCRFGREIEHVDLSNPEIRDISVPSFNSAVMIFEDLLFRKPELGEQLQRGVFKGDIIKDKVMFCMVFEGVYIDGDEKERRYIFEHADTIIQRSIEKYSEFGLEVTMDQMADGLTLQLSYPKNMIDKVGLHSQPDIADVKYLMG